MAHSLLITIVHTHSPKANNTTPIIKAKPPKAYSCRANIPVGEMFKLYGLLLPLKATNGIREEGCGGLMNMMMKERRALYVAICNIGEEVV